MSHNPGRFLLPLSAFAATARDTLSRLPLRGWLSADSLISLGMDSADAMRVVSAHLPAGIHPLLFWVRVSLALLPALILFGVAGLCCCGGALCAGILALRGLCDGAALGALVLAGRSPIPFLLRTALLLILRLTLSLWCRATAGNISDPALQHPSGVRGLSPLMQRHLAGLLASAAAGAAVCGLYSLIVIQKASSRKTRRKYTAMSSTKKGKGPLRLLNPMRDGRGVEKGEDTTPTLGYFFKLLGRKFWKLISVNLLLLVQFLPPLLCFFAYFTGPKADSQYFALYPALLGAQTAAPTATGNTLLSLFSGLFRVHAYNTPIWWIIAGLAVFQVVTYGWQKVGSAYILRNLVKGEGVFIISDYFYAIRRNLKQGFFLGLLDCLVLFALGFDFQYFYYAAPSGFTNFMYIMIVALFIIWSVMRFYIYVMLVTFDMKTRKILKNALIFTALGIKRNLMAILGIGVLLGLCVAVVMVCIPMRIYGIIAIPFFIVPALSAFMYTYAAWPVIRKYMIDPVEKKPAEAPAEP